jgi:Family of unknown function (DUF6152)
MRKLALFAAAAGGLIGFSLSVRAHHSPALYDLQRTITLEGRVESYEWANPHVYIHVDVASAGGTTETWLVEGGSPSMMERDGWFANSLQRGDHVVIQASPARNAGRLSALALTIQKGDSRPLAVRGTPSIPVTPPRPSSAESLAGNWLPTTPEQLRFVDAPPAPGQPPASTAWHLTAEGQAALVIDDSANDDQANCLSLSAPFLMAWPDLKQIELRGNEVVIRAETVDAVERHVQMNATSHAGAEFSNQGHSIGHWDGNALVVDTDHFTKHSAGDRAGLPSSPRKHVSERFELSADRARLTYSYVLEDADYLSAPVTGSVEWVYRPDLTYTPYRCDRENAERFRAK